MIEHEFVKRPFFINCSGFIHQKGLLMKTVIKNKNF